MCSSKTATAVAIFEGEKHIYWCLTNTILSKIPHQPPKFYPHQKPKSHTKLKNPDLLHNQTKNSRDIKQIYTHKNHIPDPNTYSTSKSNTQNTLHQKKITQQKLTPQILYHYTKNITLNKKTIHPKTQIWSTSQIKKKTSLSNLIYHRLRTIPDVMVFPVDKPKR